MFDTLRIQDDDVRDWFARVLQAKTRDRQKVRKERIADLNRQVTSLRNQQDELLNLRLLKEIEEKTFARKNTELRDRLSKLRLEVEACDRGRLENSDVAVKAFELSQTLTQKWLTADTRAKRQLLEIVCLNFSLDDVTLVPVMRKPFDILAEERFVPSSRGDWI